MAGPGKSLTIVLKDRPEAEIEAGKTFGEKWIPTPTEADLKDGQVLLRNLYLSLDPAMRGWLRDRRSYKKPVQIDEVMHGITVSRVLASKSKLVKAGDLVQAFGGWADVVIVDEKTITPPAFIPSPPKPIDLISGLGMTGLTAYFGMTDIGDPKPGDVVVVSGAAGATGSVAGQIAKLKGATVIGIAGTPEKVKWLTEGLGFDAGLNYKDPDFKEKFKEATKDFIDVYFDNVGGEILDMALARAKPHARFVMCGSISDYNRTESRPVKNLTSVITMRIKMQGFIIFDYQSQFPKAWKDLAQWLREGKVKTQETIVPGGLKSAENTLIGLYKGINTGKLIVDLEAHDEVSKL